MCYRVSVQVSDGMKFKGYDPFKHEPAAAAACSATAVHCPRQGSAGSAADVAVQVAAEAFGVSPIHPKKGVERN